MMGMGRVTTPGSPLVFSAMTARSKYIRASWTRRMAMVRSALPGKLMSIVPASLKASKLTSVMTSACSLVGLGRKMGQRFNPPRPNTPTPRGCRGTGGLAKGLVCRLLWSNTAAIPVTLAILGFLVGQRPAPRDHAFIHAQLASLVHPHLGQEVPVVGGAQGLCQFGQGEQLELAPLLVQLVPIPRPLKNGRAPYDRVKPVRIVIQSRVQFLDQGDQQFYVSVRPWL